MSRGAWLVLLAPALAAVAAGGCTSDLVLDLEGKACDSRRSCVHGFVCNERTNQCVRPAELNARDAGLEGSLGGDAGASSGSGSVGGTGSAAGGGAGLGGSGPLGGGGGAVPTVDAGLDASAVLPDGGCAGRIFRDGDGDGVGDISDFIDGACPEPGWVSQPGDCRDDLEDVFPGQTRFFAEPYADQTAPGDLSFDYDCSDAEEPDPSNETLDQPPNCASVLGVAGCEGSGFLPFSPPRIGANIDARCGSNLLRDCRPVTLNCVAEDTAVADEAAFRCK